MSGGGNPSSLRGFTLAEVLITLGIIGVVAALTMPSLILHHKKQEASARLKKFYSAISQAILLSEIDNGPVKDWNKADVLKNENGEVINEENRKLGITYFNTYLKPYLKYAKIDENPEDLQNEDGQSNQIRVYLADATTFEFFNGACADFRVDINGQKAPNQSGRDKFAFLICSKDADLRWHFNNKKNFGSFCIENYEVCDTRAKALALCKANSGTCTRLLEMDNFEFKNDYPYKL